MILLLSALCLAALSLSLVSMAADDQEAEVLTSFEGNLSEKELDFVTLFGFQGPYSLAVAEVVKFTAPRPGWKLNGVTVIGTDGFNGTIESIPSYRNIAVEVRDKDLNILYRFADSQLPYTNYIRNITGPVPISIALPSIPVSDEFYICFYDRGALLLALEQTNASNNSFILDTIEGAIYPAGLPAEDNETVAVNWIMIVNGN